MEKRTRQFLITLVLALAGGLYIWQLYTGQNDPIRDITWANWDDRPHPQDVYTLRLEGRELATFPEEILRMNNLEALRLDSCLFTALPGKITKLYSLREIHFHAGKFTSLPPEIFQLRQLRRIRFTDCPVQAFPKGFGDMAGVDEIAITGGEIKEVPTWIAKELLGVHGLDLSDNQIAELPPQFCRLSYLKTLNLSGNPLRELPGCRRSWKFLQAINLRKTSLQRFPEFLWHLPDLQSVDIRDTPIPLRLSLVDSLKNRFTEVRISARWDSLSREEVALLLRESDAR